MANEHIKTAATNLERAAQDVRQQQDEFRRNIEDAKRAASDKINRLKAQIAQLERDQHRHDIDTGSKIAYSAQARNLKIEIEKIEHDTNAFVQDLQHQLTNLDGQVNEFMNLARRLNFAA